MKRFFKTLLKVIVAIALLIGILYAGFHLLEYATGGKYIAYLKENSETLPLDQSFSFEKLDADIKDNRLVLVGEIHGFEEPQKFDYDLFVHLHARHQVKHYFAELDYVQALLLNEYMRNGDEALLNDVLKKWAVLQGRNNKDYYDKYRKFHAYYKQLPEEDKFMFIGVDKMQDIGLTAQFLNALIPSASDTTVVSTSIDSLLAQVRMLDSIYANAPDTLFLLSHIKTNLEYVPASKNREKVMFENFHTLYKKLCNEDDIAYGFFGLYHVFQYQVSGKQPLASLIRTSDLGLADKILSMNFLMVDSYMVRASNQLPEFMRDPGPYTKMTISADVMLFLYIYGIKDFKRMTPESHKSLIKMNSENSPYASSSRMNKTIQLLPFAELFEFDEKGKPYVQYTIFVRNSDWAEPAQ